MTETLDQPHPQTERRLQRDPHDRLVAGVCAAAGRYTDTDPVLWRVAVGVLTILGGVGLALYVLAWVLIPRTGAPQSFAERTLRGPDRRVRVRGVLLLGLIALVVLAVLDLNGQAALTLLVLGGVVLLVARDRRGGAPWPPYASSPAVPGDAGVAPPPSAYGVPPVWTPEPDRWEPPPPRERSVLGPVVLSVAALLTGLLLLLRELGVHGITGPRVLAAGLLVVGAGLVVGTWFGRARWLALVGLVLALLLVPVAALDGRIAGGVGERTWLPTATDGNAAYRLGAGEATLDLRRLEPGSVDALSARVGVGRLLVLVPDDLRVRVRPDVGVGDLLVDDGQRTTSEDSPTFDDRSYADVVLGPGTGSELVLDAVVGLGEVEVRRVTS